MKNVIISCSSLKLASQFKFFFPPSLFVFLLVFSVHILLLFGDHCIIVHVLCSFFLLLFNVVLHVFGTHHVVT